MTLAAVIGTVFVDCKGFAKGNYHPFGRNLGNIQFVHGGVARNVVENLGNMCIPSVFVSTVDDNGIGQEVVERLIKSGIAIDYLETVPEYGMGMWLAILDGNGDLAGSVSQMPELAALERMITQKGSAIVRSASHIVLELDLNADITENVIALAKQHGKPVYGIPGNLSVVLSRRNVLKDLECFICNDIEGEKLLDKPYSKMGIEQMQQELKIFVERVGMRSMVITLGSRGSVYYDARTKEAGYQPVFPVNLIDSCGAGDAFFSGTVMGLIKGASLKDAVRYGTKVAAYTIQSPENTCLDLYEKMQHDVLFAPLIGEAKELLA